jgi:hypothetical protein
VSSDDEDMITVPYTKKSPEKIQKSPEKIEDPDEN